MPLPPAYLRDYETDFMATFHISTSSCDPFNYEEAVKGPRQAEWKISMSSGCNIV